ncbi:MAG TPA: hypothetical protein VGG17_03645 [Acidimicrobiales bacterium]|jgi:photosystem II stability/assembly factor-like uncharacterized protein
MLLSRAGTSNVVYVFAESRCASRKCARLYRSNVGATNFSRVTAPPVKLDVGAFPDSTLEKLVFANPSDGYALVAYGNFGVALYATSDGAHTWRRVTRIDRGEMTLFVSSSRVFTSTVLCKPRTSDCTQWVTRRSSLATNQWTTIPSLWRTGTRNDDVFYGPALAAYGDRIWELETGPEIDMWISRNDGRSFASRPEPQLGSVSGCSFTTMSATSMWAECPTGMQVSFLHSSDGGVRWSAIQQTQFFGTGGGAFAPVSSDVAYLDYGLDNGPNNLFRLTAGGRNATPVADLTCASVPSMIFTNASDGLMLCNENYTSIQVRRTDDGGETWSTVELPGN